MHKDEPANMKQCVSDAIHEAQIQTQTATLHVQMDAEMKRKATEALSAMGLTASQAVRSLFHRIAIDQAFALKLGVPNTHASSALAKENEMVNIRSPSFTSADEMFAKPACFLALPRAP